MFNQALDPCSVSIHLSLCFIKKKKIKGLNQNRCRDELLCANCGNFLRTTFRIGLRFNKKTNQLKGKQFSSGNPFGHSNLKYCKICFLIIIPSFTNCKENVADGWTDVVNRNFTTWALHQTHLLLLQAEPPSAGLVLHSSVSIRHLSPDLHKLKWQLCLTSQNDYINQMQMCLHLKS